MIFHKGWNEEAVKELARDCNSAQLLSDVSFFRRLHYIGARTWILWGDAGFICGYFHKSRPSFRIVGIGTTLNYRGRGYGLMLLREAERQARGAGCEWIETRTTDGLRFYLKNGYELTGLRGGGWILKKTLVNG